MPGALTWAILLEAALTDISPLGASIVIGPALPHLLPPCGSYYDCKTHFSKSHQRTLKKKHGLLLTGPGGYMACVEPHSEVMGRKRVRVQAWASFIGV